VFVLYDLEFTSWEGAPERGWTGVGERREVVQIGALKIDERALEVTGEFDALVRPVHNPVLSEYFKELTGISQDAVDERGIPFLDALDSFLDFCDGDYALSYGNDMVIIGENLVLQVPEGRKPKRGLPPFVNLATYLHRVLPVTNGVPSGRLASVLGSAPPMGQVYVHDAVADCYSILEALRHLRALGLSWTSAAS
jgi:hypothetical protein